jgi:hypothetical protein
MIYSPLATSNTTLVLRTSPADLAQVQYKWNMPGNLLSFTFQFNLVPIDAVSCGILANYTWMEIRGNAQLDFENATAAVSRQKDVMASLTKFVLQGGLTLGVTF